MFISLRLRDNREFMLEVVRENGLSLGYASQNLRSYHRLVLVAVRQNGKALKYASDEIKHNLDFIISGYRGNDNSINDLYSYFKDIFDLNDNDDKIRLSSYHLGLISYNRHKLLDMINHC